VWPAGSTQAVAARCRVDAVNNFRVSAGRFTSFRVPCRSRKKVNSPAADRASPQQDLTGRSFAYANRRFCSPVIRHGFAQPTPGTVVRIEYSII
jgi:hypothetical protein